MLFEAGPNRAGLLRQLVAESVSSGGPIIALMQVRFI